MSSKASSAHAPGGESKKRKSVAEAKHEKDISKMRYHAARRSKKGIGKEVFINPALSKRGQQEEPYTRKHYVPLTAPGQETHRQYVSWETGDDEFGAAEMTYGMRSSANADYVTRLEDEARQKRMDYLEVKQAAEPLWRLEHAFSGYILQ